MARQAKRSASAHWDLLDEMWPLFPPVNILRFLQGLVFPGTALCTDHKAFLKCSGPTASLTVPILVSLLKTEFHKYLLKATQWPCAVIKTQREGCINRLTPFTAT